MSSVAVVALRLDEPAALADGHERGADGGVAVRVELHRGADDVGDLVEAAVVHVPERVEHAALDGLQAVVDVRHGAVEDDVARVVEEPVAVAAAPAARRLARLDFFPRPPCGGGGGDTRRRRLRGGLRARRRSLAAAPAGRNLWRFCVEPWKFFAVA